MPAKSRSQQRFMGMVHNCQKTGKCASKEVAKTAKSMKKKDAEDFASTKHAGLPDKKKKQRKKKKKIKENTMNKEKKLSVGFINDIYDKNYSAARHKLAGIVDEKIKGRIRNIASGTIEEKAKPSAGTTKKKRSETVKKAKKGKDIGKKGKNFKKVAAKAAKEYGSKKKGEKVAAAAMWKNMGKK